MKRLFEIQTLSDRVYPSLGDPITILTGGLAIVTQLFPNIFGGSRKRLTESDWQQIFPGNGYWGSLIRKYLQGKIVWDTDMKYAYPFVNSQGRTEQGHIANFVMLNRLQICPDIPPDCFISGGYNVPCQSCMNKFSELLKSETSFPGGGQTYPGVNIAGFDFAKALPYLAVGGLALLILNKKKSRKK